MINKQLTIAFLFHRPSGAGGGGGVGREQRGCQTPQSSLLMSPFLQMIPLNVLFLTEVTNNVRENQQAKSGEVRSLFSFHYF